MQSVLRIIGAAGAWLLRGLGWLAAVCILALIVLFGGWLFLRPSPPPPSEAALHEPYAGESFVAEAATGPAPPPAPAQSADCWADGRFAQIAKANAVSAANLVWTPFGPEEIGWETYAPLAAAEIGTACAFNEPGFAAALAGWQRRNGLGGAGAMTAQTFEAMKVRWHRRRPFSRIQPENCPPPPAAQQLATATAGESYGKAILLRPGALAAYRRMLAAARAEAPEVFSGPSDLKIFSAYRDPEADAARCETDGNCDGVRRTLCSAHRTGLALDIYVGMAPGGDPASTAAFNRLAQSKTPAYRWLVRNAGRFGFVNYAFEPWHWEWTGEPI
jgi:D-alanyl-D-alanine carboxypeptidase